MPILQETTNLIRLYRHICGQSEVPSIYHIWSCLSLMAACVQDRVWVEKMKSEKLLPHLYIFLVGPPAVGKGVAMKIAHKLYLEAGGIHSYKGRATFAHLLDKLGKVVHEEGKLVLPKPKLWVVMEELADCVGKGVLADSFIKLMTNLYTSSDDVLDTGTRTHGGFRVIDPCVNWIVGTTEEWMIDTLTKDAIDSGFVSRLVFVYGKYSPMRYYRPIFPIDYDEVRAHIVARLHALHYVQGKFIITPAAEAQERSWYQNRKEPGDRILLTSWHREHDLILKLSMLLSLADAGPLVIDAHHILRAIKLSTSIQVNIRKVVHLARRTPILNATEEIESRLKRAGDIQHSKLLTEARVYGLTAKPLREIMMTLIQEGKVESWRSDTGARMYKWAGEQGDTS